MPQIYPPQPPSPTPFGGPKKSVQAQIPTMPRTSHVGVPPTQGSRAYYVDVARQAARRHGIPENLFLAQIQWESGFNPAARSKAGAIGIAQIVPRWHPGVDPTNPEQALDYGAKHMATLYRNLGRWDYALAGYNAGADDVRRNGDNWSQYKPETQNYVRGILKMSGMSSEGLGGRTRNEASRIRTARQGAGMPPHGSPMPTPPGLPPRTLPRASIEPPQLAQIPYQKVAEPTVSFAQLLPQMMANPQADRLALLMKLLPSLSPQVKAALPR